MRASRWLCRRCASGGNWYYGDAVYGPLYYGFGGAGEVGDRQVMARSYDEMFAQLDLERNIMAHKKGKQQFEEVVFKKELAEISHRRKAANSQQPDVETNLSPSAEHGLVGLAPSGGGIRSATLCLGALQALAKRGVLRSVDYLSTVSGGGFIGSCLSSVMNKTDAEPQGDAFPFGYTPGSEEHAAVRHLRNSSNYLAPGGLLDKIRIPMVVLRGTLINLFMFLPVLIFAVLATEIVYIFGHYGNIRSFYKLVRNQA